MKPMKQNTDRHADAEAYTQERLERSKTTPIPSFQKYPPGARVRIATDLGPTMAHFPSNQDATVVYTYAHVYGGGRPGVNGDIYCLDVDGVGKVLWYYEHQLSPI